MANLLVVSHAPSPNTRRIEHVARQRAAGEVPALRWLAPLAAGPADVGWCDGIVIATTENFGSMAGRTKDFFERIYYPCREHTAGLPVAAWVRAGEDGAGTVAQLERIVTGLKWRWIQAPLVLHGDWQPGFVDAAAELTATLAAGLEAGIF